MRNKEFPEVRFVDFTKEWEQHKIGELAEIVRGASPRPIQDPKWFDVNSEVGWLRIADVTEQNGRIHYLKQRISIAGQKKTRVLNTPHLLLSIAATVGKPVVNYVKTGVHDGFLIFQNPVFDREFMFQWLEMFRPKWDKYGQPGSQVNLNSDLVKSQEIMVPNKEEQTKIGLFFKELDDTISLHQQELNTLKQTKQGFLQKMFPKEGESVPEFRLPDFGAEWQKSQIGEIATIVRGASPRPIQDPKWFDKESKVGWLRISDVTKQDGRIHYLEQRISMAGQEKTRVLKEPHLLLSIAATVGKPVINYVETGVHDGFLIFLNPKFDIEFMFQWLEMFRPRWNKYGQPGSQVNLNSELVKSHEIYLPDIDEQIQIGNFFKQLDELIALQQQELDALKQTKKAFLQKMFV